MTYQVLARKWRPRGFDQLIGQEPIVTALRNTLREGRIAQAYVFSGIRGVGKTTAARVLAKALNCEQGPTAEPCNNCLPCREIAAGADLDVLEIDAATYSKVEQIRELTESLRYGPARDRYKVVVLDEVHRLSRQAFDALLKIVEEPPARLVFIFATTELDAVPATILSRCQEYSFRRVPAKALVAHLRMISEAESITASDGALRLIARAGEGSVRDSVALLDQLATFGGGRIEEEDAARLVGGMDVALFRSTLVAILAGDGGGVANAVAKVEEQGWDPRQVYGHFLSYCRSALHAALSRVAGTNDFSDEESGELVALARQHGYEPLLRLLHFLLQSESIVRRSEVGVLALEICWLRAAELPKLDRITDVLAELSGLSEPWEQSGRSGDGGPAGRTRPSPSVAPPARKSTAPAMSPMTPMSPMSPMTPMTPMSPMSQMTPPVASPQGAAAANPPVVRPPAVEEVEAPVTAASALGTDGLRLLDAVNKRRPALAARLGEAIDISFSDGRVTLTFPNSAVDTEQTLRRPAARVVIEEAIAECFGANVDWQLAKAAATSQPTRAATPGVAAGSADRRVPIPSAVSEHPTVQAVLEIFNGTVAGVVERPSTGGDS